MIKAKVHIVKLPEKTMASSELRRIAGAPSKGYVPEVLEIISGKPVYKLGCEVFHKSWPGEEG